MFIRYLLLTLSISLILSLTVARVFRPSMNRIIADEVSNSWIGYLKYAIIVVGVSGGVPIYQIENVLNSGRTSDTTKLVMDMDFFIFEAFRTSLNTLQALAWVLLFFFTTFLAVIIVKTSELRRGMQK